MNDSLRNVALRKFLLNLQISKAFAIVFFSLFCVFLHIRLSVFLIKCIVVLDLSCIYLVFRSKVFQGSRAQVLKLCGEILRQCSTTCILRSHLLSLLLMLHLLDSIIIVASPTQFWYNKVSAQIF